MRTILHTVDTPGPGGAETICVELAAGLDPGRFRSAAAVLGPGWTQDAFRRRGLEPVLVPSGRGPVDPILLVRLAAAARRAGADLIQCHLLGTSLYGALAARLLGIRAVATFHGMVDVHPADRRARLKLRLIAANASRLVFVSDALRRHFCDIHDVARERTAVVPNGIDADAFVPERHRRLRGELGIPDDAVLVGAVGNIRPPKGYGDLLQVAARLAGERPEMRFVVAGEPADPLMGDLLGQRQALGLEKRVFFLGFRRDVPEVLNGLDIYLSTSISEGFSLTTVQAMACGLPVVATSSGGPQEIVTHGVDGILAPVGDIGAIAGALGALGAEPARRVALGEAARQTVLRRFTVQRMVAAYEAIYDAALAPSTPVAGR